MSNLDKKNYLNMIRSKYILEQIMDNLLKKKLLQIIRFNKNLKNKLNTSTNDY